MGLGRSHNPESVNPREKGAPAAECPVIQGPLTLKFALKPEAFTYDHGSGLSVSSGHVAKEVGWDVARGVNWETHGAAVFPVGIARTSCSGVVSEPTSEDPSHGLVRVEGDGDKRRRC